LIVEAVTLVLLKPVTFIAERYSPISTVSLTLKADDDSEYAVHDAISPEKTMKTRKPRVTVAASELKPILRSPAEYHAVRHAIARNNPPLVGYAVVGGEVGAHQEGLRRVPDARGE